MIDDVWRRLGVLWCGLCFVTTGQAGFFPKDVSSQGSSEDCVRISFHAFR